MKFGWTVLQVNIYQLMKFDFCYDMILVSVGLWYSSAGRQANDVGSYGKS